MAHSRQLILNRYRPIAEAGSGGFGTVQVAWDTRIQRKVAIKIIELDEFDAARLAGPAAPAPDDAPAGDLAPVGPSPLEGAPEPAGLPWDDDDDRDMDFGADRGGAVPADAVAYDDLPPLSDEDPFGASAGAAGPADDPAEDEDPESQLFEHSMAHVPGLDEARTAAMLSDASIVAVYDFEVQGTTAYLIMEYVEGITLTKLLRDYDDELTLDIVGAVFGSVARALDVAHENQVLHLDIKPDNILINRQGQVKVTDFGLATLMDASGNGRAGGGTIGYMPPEQMRQEPLDARCDEWALASVTYTMLAGKNPFLAPTLEEALQAIENAELVLPSLCWDGLDEAADDVIFYALDPDPDERYDFVYEFAEELEPLLGDPKRGRRELAAIVGDAELEDDEAPDEGAGARRRRQRREHIPLRDRITHRKRTVGAHAIGALGAAAVGALGVLNVPLLGGAGDPIAWAIVAALAVLGAIWPHVGALLAYVALSLALALQGSVVLGCVLLVATAAWWYFAGRGGKAAANVALAAPVLGGFGAGQLVPLLTGLSLRPARAAGTAAFCVLAAAALAACGSGSLIGWNAFVNWDFSYAGQIQQTLLGLLARPETWCVAISWPAAAAALAAFRLRRTRPFAVMGVLAAAVVLMAGLALAAWLASGQGTWVPGAADIARTLLPVAFALFVCALLPEEGRDD